MNREHIESFVEKLQACEHQYRLQNESFTKTLTQLNQWILQLEAKCAFLESTQQSQHANLGASNNFFLNSIGNGGNIEENIMQLHFEAMEIGDMEPMQLAQGMEEIDNCNIL
jgi:hypothetical protein